MAAIAFYVEYSRLGVPKDFDEVDTFDEMMAWFKEHAKPGVKGKIRFTNLSGRPLTTEQQDIFNTFSISLK